MYNPSAQKPCTKILKQVILPGTLSRAGQFNSQELIDIIKKQLYLISPVHYRRKKVSTNTNGNLTAGILWSMVESAFHNQRDANVEIIIPNMMISDNMPNKEFGSAPLATIHLQNLASRFYCTGKKALEFAKAASAQGNQEGASKLEKEAEKHFCTSQTILGLCRSFLVTYLDNKISLPDNTDYTSDDMPLFITGRGMIALPKHENKP